MILVRGSHCFLAIFFSYLFDLIICAYLDLCISFYFEEILEEIKLEMLEETESFINQGGVCFFYLMLNKTFFNLMLNST